MNQKHSSLQLRRLYKNVDESFTFQHGFDGNRLFGYLDIHLEDLPIRAL